MRLPRVSLHLLASCLAILLVAACRPEPPASAHARPDVSGCSVLVYCIDTLRADHLGCYGYPRETSPFLDQLAGDSLLFENAIAQGPWTVPSVASLVTSTYPSTHGVIAGGRRLPASVQTMAELFAGAGYHTAGFIHNMHAGSVIGADQGYQDYLEALPPGTASDQERKRSRSLGPILDWIKAWPGDKPFFLYVHTTEPHWPYHSRRPFGSLSLEQKNRILEQLDTFRRLTRKAPGEDQAAQAARVAKLREVQELLRQHRQEIVDLYDNEVRQADAHVERIVGALREKGLWQETLFVLLADHGQEMDEHGYWQHDQSLYQELIHVPLLVKLAGRSGPGRRIEEPVQVIDILPTIAQLTGQPPLSTWEGRSLVGLIEGRDVPREMVFSERLNISKSDPAIQEERGDFETALVRRGGFKAIWHRQLDRLSLFDLRDDPGEQRPLGSAAEARARQIRALFRRWLDRPHQALGFEEARLTREQIEGLRELGYLK